MFKQILLLKTICKRSQVPEGTRMGREGDGRGNREVRGMEAGRTQMEAEARGREYLSKANFE